MLFVGFLAAFPHSITEQNKSRKLRMDFRKTYNQQIPADKLKFQPHQQFPTDHIFSGGLENSFFQFTRKKCGQ